jgi:hypothetical protein
MALSDYKNLKWLREGSDADWKKALEEQRLMSMGKEALKSSAYTPTERMITNPLSSGLEFLNVDPRFARQVAKKTASSFDYATPIPMAAEGGQMAGVGLANKDYGQAGLGTLLAALGINPVTKRTSAPVSSGFERTFVGQQLESKAPNWDDMLGGSLFTFPSDSSSRGYLINQISGKPIDTKFQKVTEGGFMFGKDKELAKKNIVYASNESAANNQLKRARLESERNLSKGGTGKIFVAPATMAEGGENFSTMPTELIYGLSNTQGLTGNQLSVVDDMVRNYTNAGKKPYADWVGLSDSGALEQLRTGEGLLGSASGLRKVVKEKYGSVTGQKALGYNINDLNNALLDPNLINAPKHHMGDVWYQLDLNKGIRPSAEGSRHRSYSHDFIGQNVGSTNLAPVKDVFGDVYGNIEKTIPTHSYKGIQIPESTRQLNTIHSLRDLHDNSALYLDEQAIDRLKRLFGQQ